MPARTAAHNDRLTSAQFTEAMGLPGDVDSVEIKLTVPVEQHRATIFGLPIDPVEAESREVYFFDTPDLALNRAGVVVRARRIRGGGGDTVVKLRPVVPADLPDKVLHSDSFTVEVDCMPGGFLCSASLKGKTSSDAVRHVGEGTMKLGKILSKEQRAFYRAHAPRGLAMDSLAALGPTFVLKSVFWPKELQRKTVMELWMYPDGTRLLELSTKSSPAEGPVVHAEFRSYLAGRGVTFRGEQQTKTKRALDFHSAQLKAHARKQARREPTVTNR